MHKIGFDNDKYLKLQSENIRKRIRDFGGKLYLEYGGKLFDDHHAARVLPGFQPDSKVKLLLEMRDEAGAAEVTENTEETDDIEETEAPAEPDAEEPEIPDDKEAEDEQDRI